MRTLGIIVVLLLWFLFGWRACTDYNTCCVKEEVKETVVPAPAPVKKLLPLVFNWGNKTPITSSAWPAYRDSILRALGTNKKLEITGYYRANEANNTPFTNLGLARADSTWRALFSQLPKERVDLLGVLRDEKAGERTNEFVSASFAARNMEIEENIKKIDDRTLIYFPFNSTDKLNDAGVEAYLNDVAERLKRTNEKVRLVGHTDNVDSNAFNLGLGQRRADVIKNYLIRKGVPSNRISSTSAGESQPIASNENSAGRAKNRRTELRITN